jgi:hypothetical protein
MAVDELIEAWRATTLSEPPFLLPEDEFILHDTKVDWHWRFHTLADFVDSEAFGER